MQKEKCQVIFFPLKHTPTFLQMSELADMRDRFRYLIQQINYEERNNPYQRTLRKEIFHNKMRDKFKLIQGEKGETTAQN